VNAVSRSDLEWLTGNRPYTRALPERVRPNKRGAAFPGEATSANQNLGTQRTPTRSRFGLGSHFHFQYDKHRTDTFEYMTKKPIVFFVNHLHKGGMQRAIANITSALSPDFPTIVAFFGTEDPGYDFGGKLIELGEPGQLSISLMSRIVKTIKRIFIFRRMIREIGAETVISFGESSALFNLLSGASNRIISVRVSIREFTKEFSRINRLYAKLLIFFGYRHASSIISVSDEIKEELTTNFSIPSGKISVINNLYDGDSIRSSSLESLPDDHEEIFRDPVVLNVGSLCHQKGQVYLIDAFHHLLEHKSAARLVFIGRGEDKDKLSERANGLGIGSRVHFLGHQSNPYRYMRRCHTFALSSLYEGFPNVLVEAMFCGAPVISFDCPTGPREIIKFSRGNDEASGGKFGILVPRKALEGNPEEAAKLLSIEMLKMFEPGISEHYKALSLLRSGDFNKGMIIGQWIDAIRGRKRSCNDLAT